MLRDELHSRALFINGLLVLCACYSIVLALVIVRPPTGRPVGVADTIRQLAIATLAATTSVLSSRCAGTGIDQSNYAVFDRDASFFVYTTISKYDNLHRTFRRNVLMSLWIHV